MSEYHTPVLLDEVISYLQPSPESVFIDCTFGGGGHTKALLSAGASVYALDQDAQAVEQAKEITDSKLTIIQSNFAKLHQVAAEYSISFVDGILYDLGVSSRQLDAPERGFSFQKEAPLDMRMDDSLGVTAADLVAALGEKELIHLFHKYGDESFARPIARKIVTQRKKQPIRTTLELADLIASVKKTRGKLHPATKVFQALRIAVNDELNSLEESLPQAVDLLKPGGRLVAISFHEGEDRILKHFIKEKEQHGVLQTITHKPVTPSQTEINTNIRSRSAKLRVAEKV